MKKSYKVFIVVGVNLISIKETAVKIIKKF